MAPEAIKTKIITETVEMGVLRKIVQKPYEIYTEAKT